MSEFCLVVDGPYLANQKLGWPTNKGCVTGGHAMSKVVELAGGGYVIDEAILSSINYYHLNSFFPLIIGHGGVTHDH